MTTLGSICETCNNNHDGAYGSGRFCASKCARAFSTKDKRQEINEKVSKKLKGKTPEGFAAMQTREAKDKATASHRARSQVIRVKKEKAISLKPFDDVAIGTKKKRILEEQNNLCNRCGLGEWMGEPLVLELEHKDGDRTNNKRNNLECLCPNCHSLTKTWRGRNTPFQRRVTDEDYILALRQTRSIHQALLALGLAPKGNNYTRAKRLVKQHNIDVLFQSRTQRSQLLTEEQVEMIRSMRENEGRTFKEIANHFGISKTAVSNIVNTRTYIS